MCKPDDVKPNPPDSKKGDASHYADPCAECDKTSLHVKVVHARTGKPLDAIEAAVSGKPKLKTAKDGWAHWDPIAPGSYDVSARDDSCTPDPAEKKGVDVALGEREEVELKLQPLEWRMHVDADRDGTVDAGWTDGEPWTPGAGKTGAVVLVNSDRDDPKRGTKRDHEDNKVNTADDVPDLSPLDLRRTIPGKTFPKGTTATLTVSDTDKLRIFDSRTAGGKEIIGPKKGASHTWKYKDMLDKVELGMEGAEYNVNPADKGEVELTLAVSLSGAKLYEQKVTVRLAPFMLFHHLQKTKRVHVLQTTDNVTFVGELEKVTGAAALKKGVGYGGDRWMQDVMEPGYASHTAGGLRNVPAVLQSKQTRAIAAYPGKEMLGKDFGWLNWKSPPPNRPTHDSFGNLECAPPHTDAGGVKYPFGRIIFGKGTSSMDWEVVNFLKGQLVQKPIEVDTSWLAVGHVDEFISFLPWSGGTHGFALVLASPQRALDILKDKGTPKTAKLVRGFAAPDGPGAAQEKTDAEAHYALDTVDKFLKDGAMVALQTTVQKTIDKVEKQLVKELNLDAKKDVVKWPVLFEEYNGTPGIHIAYTAGSVNMLVFTTSKTKAKLAIPKPFGPTVGATCKFEADILATLSVLGYAKADARFIDDFCTYHVNAGEIHCGTNSEREPSGTEKWWDLDWI